MPVSPKLLELIVCPLTKTRLSEADADRVKTILADLETGKIKTRGATDWAVADVTGLLVTEDGRVAYPVVGDVPNLLPSSCILVVP